MYLIDANVFIDAKNRYYGFDIVPAFWDWLEQAHLAGKVFTVQKVADEITAGGDQLAVWMKKLPASFRVSPGASDQASLSAVSRWVSGSAVFTPAAVSTFLSSADYFLVSQAHALGYTVVTHETPNPHSKKRIKIPDVCNAFAVKWVSPFKVLSDENVRFRL